jgi:hypothetical protein
MDLAGFIAPGKERVRTGKAQSSPDNVRRRCRVRCVSMSSRYGRIDDSKAHNVQKMKGYISHGDTRGSECSREIIIHDK